MPSHDPRRAEIQACQARLCSGCCSAAEKVQLGNRVFALGLELEREADATQAHRVKGQRF